ncbi:MAG: hypothetical protein AAF928_00465 [Myxococcota bacterium]
MRTHVASWVFVAVICGVLGAPVAFGASDDRASSDVYDDVPPQATEVAEPSLDERPPRRVPPRREPDAGTVPDLHPDFVRVSRPNLVLLVWGSLWLGGGCIGGGIAAAYADDDPGPENWAPVFIPVAGPFLGLASMEGRAVGPLIMSGTIQMGGVGLLIGSFVLSDEVVRKRSTAHNPLPFMVAPDVAPHRAGVRLYGEF